MAIIAAGCVLAASRQADAQDAPAAWLKKPTSEDLIGVWPPSAAQSGTGGQATISCIVTLQGTLRNCVVVSETPAGSGFGQAGLVLAPQFLMKPATKDGKPVESMVNIPIKWPELNRTFTGSRTPSVPPLGDPPSRIIGRVVWETAPTVGEVLAAYPAKARAAKISGHATIDCTFTADGTLHECETLREDPAGNGFGLAARKLAAKFVGPKLDGAGQPLKGAHVQVPIVFAAESLDSGAVIGKPQWTALPGFADLTDAFPKEAIKADILKGRVVLHCTVGVAGALTDCDVRSEEPLGYGLGKATASLMGKFRVSVWSEEGLPTVGGTVNVPIRYDLSDRPPAPKP
jgi:TonB family protein